MSCFADDKDRHVFLGYLEDALTEGGVSLHAYVLMSNHVHFLATGHCEGAIASMMHAIGMRYARYFNTSRKRTGPLFEGRYRASLVEKEHYFFTCMRYIELNPVRAGMVARPADYRWSSYRHNAGLETRSFLMPHEDFLRLGPALGECASAWVAFVDEGICPDDLDRIRRQIARNRPLGSAAFLDRLKIMGTGVHPSP